eukprot:TRINITY_DN11748_c0_g1_i1.p1 TRINITY_DN11748_c0_g1~~TRINITY_DN11748_c0_g1_i1.p1  ORF type:complete len:1088 (-),score=212.75 TRINITY_DN11748_c0_g1_i1:241-3504(-)
MSRSDQRGDYGREDRGGRDRGRDYVPASGRGRSRPEPYAPPSHGRGSRAPVDDRRNHGRDNDDRRRGDYGGGHDRDHRAPPAPMTEKDRLVQKVKGIQRTDSAGKEKWESFADAARMGSRDPCKHPEQNLKLFLDALEKGEDPVDAAATVGGGRFLRMRGVPFQSTMQDVVEFLATFKVQDSQIAFARRHDGKPTGEAYVMFRSGTQAERALDELQKQEIHGRYIELFRSTEEEYEYAARANSAMDQDQLVARVKQIQRSGPDAKELWYKFCEDTKTGNRDPARHTVESLRNFVEAFDKGETPEVPASLLENGTVLRLRGVPFQCGLEDVVEFLTEFAVDASNVVFSYSRDGKKTGEAFIDFNSADLADEAFQSKQKQEIQGRYIELFRCTKDDFRQAKLRQPGHATESFVGTSPSAPSKGHPNWQEDRDYDAPGDSYQQDHRGSGNEHDNLVREVKKIQKSAPENRERWESFCNLLHTGNRDPKLHSIETLQRFVEAVQNGDDTDQVARDIGASSRVLRLRGVPFQGTLEDVLDFMKDFNVERSNACLGKNREGRPSGEAFIMLANAEEAERALEDRQRQEIHGRYIEVFRSCEEDFQHAYEISGSGGEQNDGSPPILDKEALIAEVKRIQRSTPDGKTKWEDYCEILRTGNRDPARHTCEAMKAFIEAYRKGETPQQAFFSPVLRIRGVPFQAEVAEVVEFLTDYHVEEAQIILVRGSNGKKTGEAFVEFSSSDLAERALEDMQKKEIQGRFIEFFRSSYEEREPFEKTSNSFTKEALVVEVKTIQRSSPDGRERWEKFCDLMKTGNRDPLRHAIASMKAFVDASRKNEELEDVVSRLCANNNVLRLRGVPFQCRVSAVVDFLADFQVEANNVLLVTRDDGKHTGEALVQFHSPEAAEAALVEKQNQQIEGRYIELFRSCQAEMDETRESASSRAHTASKRPREDYKESPRDHGRDSGYRGRDHDRGHSSGKGVPAAFRQDRDGGSRGGYDRDSGYSRPGGKGRDAGYDRSAPPGGKGREGYRPPPPRGRDDGYDRGRDNGYRPAGPRSRDDGPVRGPPPGFSRDDRRPQHSGPYDRSRDNYGRR